MPSKNTRRESVRIIILRCVLSQVIWLIYNRSILSIRLKIPRESRVFYRTVLNRKRANFFVPTLSREIIINQCGNLFLMQTVYHTIFEKNKIK